MRQILTFIFIANISLFAEDKLVFNARVLSLYTETDHPEKIECTIVNNTSNCIKLFELKHSIWYFGRMVVRTEDSTQTFIIRDDRSWKRPAIVKVKTKHTYVDTITLYPNTFVKVGCVNPISCTPLCSSDEFKIEYENTGKRIARDELEKVLVENTQELLPHTFIGTVESNWMQADCKCTNGKIGGNNDLVEQLMNVEYIQECCKD